MTCPYCGSDDVDLIPSESGGSPTAKCTKCGAALDPQALATQVEAGKGRSRGARAAGGILGAIAVLVLMIGLARPHSHPARVRDRSVPRMSVPAGETVYVTRTGMKFHRSGCQYLREGHERMSRDEAVARGYAPCSVCQP